MEISFQKLFYSSRRGALLFLASFAMMAQSAPFIVFAQTQTQTGQTSVPSAPSRGDTTGSSSTQLQNYYCERDIRSNPNAPVCMRTNDTLPGSHAELFFARDVNGRVQDARALCEAACVLPTGAQTSPMQPQPTRSTLTRIDVLKILWRVLLANATSLSFGTLRGGDTTSIAGTGVTGATEARPTALTPDIIIAAAMAPVAEFIKALGLYSAYGTASFIGEVARAGGEVATAASTMPLKRAVTVAQLYAFALPRLLNGLPEIFAGLVYSNFTDIASRAARAASWKENRAELKKIIEAHRKADELYKGKISALSSDVQKQLVVEDAGFKALLNAAGKALAEAGRIANSATPDAGAELRELGKASEAVFALLRGNYEGKQFKGLAKEFPDVWSAISDLQTAIVLKIGAARKLQLWDISGGTTVTPPAQPPSVKPPVSPPLVQPPLPPDDLLGDPKKIIEDLERFEIEEKGKIISGLEKESDQLRREDELNQLSKIDNYNRAEAITLMLDQLRVAKKTEEFVLEQKKLITNCSYTPENFVREAKKFGMAEFVMPALSAFEKNIFDEAAKRAREGYTDQFSDPPRRVGLLTEDTVKNIHTASVYAADEAGGDYPYKKKKGRLIYGDEGGKPDVERGVIGAGYGAIQGRVEQIRIIGIYIAEDALEDFVINCTQTAEDLIGHVLDKFNKYITDTTVAGLLGGEAIREKEGAILNEFTKRYSGGLDKLIKDIDTTVLGNLKKVGPLLQNIKNSFDTTRPDVEGLLVEIESALKVLEGIGVDTVAAAKTVASNEDESRVRARGGVVGASSGDGETVVSPGSAGIGAGVGKGVAAQPGLPPFLLPPATAIVEKFAQCTIVLNQAVQEMKSLLKAALLNYVDEMLARAPEFMLDMAKSAIIAGAEADLANARKILSAQLERLDKIVIKAADGSLHPLQQKALDQFAEKKLKFLSLIESVKNLTVDYKNFPSFARRQSEAKSYRTVGWSNDFPSIVKQRKNFVPLTDREIRELYEGIEELIPGYLEGKKWAAAAAGIANLVSEFARNIFATYCKNREVTLVALFDAAVEDAKLGLEDGSITGGGLTEAVVQALVAGFEKVSGYRPGQITQAVLGTANVQQYIDNTRKALEAADKIVNKALDLAEHNYEAKMGLASVTIIEGIGTSVQALSKEIEAALADISGSGGLARMLGASAEEIARLAAQAGALWERKKQASSEVDKLLEKVREEALRRLRAQGVGELERRRGAWKKDGEEEPQKNR